MDNLMKNVNYALVNKQYKDGLNAYTQSNCQVTLTDDGFHIYRPPNKTVSADGQTMWGGLRIRNSSVNSLHEYNSNTDNIFKLVKGHTYIIRFHVSGKSSNAAASIGWTNQMGWGGGGLLPSPTNVSYQYTPANFNGEMDCYYKWTQSDDFYKTCTSAYSSFVQGKQYMSYYDFMYGFGYTDTGTLGTDVYITNIRMYDLIDGTEIDISKIGLVETSNIMENSNIVSINNIGEVRTNNLIEY